ncbi:MAG TPA: diaminopimelate decarboxylase [Thermoanaerobaculia bacterium]|nr:diaminopimelate decarboxylase [Thermoanaerobaculia bacterium]
MIEYREDELFIGGTPAPALVRKFGSPLYVYDASVIDRQIRRLTDAFGDLPFQPFYAAKANSNLDILRMIRNAGFGCDAVSPGEVFLARKAGFDAERIWFTSTHVSDDDFRALTNPAVTVNIDSMSALERIVKLKLRNPISFRVNPDVGAGHHRDVVTGGYGVKFGFDRAEVGEARIWAESAGLRLVGLHAHIGSGISEIAPLLDAARVLLSLSEEFATLRWLNFGGGIATPYRPGEPEFPLEEFARSLTAIARERLSALRATAVLEPGRFLLAPAGLLLSTVTGKRISGGTTWIGCDTGFHHLARPSKYGSYHHILNASRGSEAWLPTSGADPALLDGEEAIVAGNLCESGDILTRGQEGPESRWLPPTREGDILAFCDAGAYGFSMASHYNARLLPAEVLVQEGNVRLIRERQRFDDLLAGQFAQPR